MSEVPLYCGTPTYHRLLGLNKLAPKSIQKLGLCYQLGGDNIAVLSAVISLPADKN